MPYEARQHHTKAVPVALVHDADTESVEHTPLAAATLSHKYHTDLIEVVTTRATCLRLSLINTTAAVDRLSCALGPN